uniref:DUF4346 domain-containing protein n=1 Tax=Caloglossa monosticha TaxID=76906 RepID=A0A1Z1M4M0_9FLOR|nr:hypothetical protein [Caloglossa monosticha]ARW61008.1 hypothetical protein [Caloglossa monosticha]
MDDIYFLIKIIDIQKIDLYFVKKSIGSLNIYNYPICFTASNTDLLIFLLKTHSLIDFITPGHFIYLGKELLKTEICIFSKQKYIQD